MLIKKRDADVIKYIFDTFNEVNLGKLGIDEAFKLIQDRLSKHIKSEAVFSRSDCTVQTHTEARLK